jgi:hypothetical protein
MGTRSIIALALPSGSFKSIYCHWDGYPEAPGVGAVLLDHYQDRDKVVKLLALGDLSSLGPDIGVKHPFAATRPAYPPDTGDREAYFAERDRLSEEHERLYGRMCLAYGRDRGEKNVRARTHKTFKGLAKSLDSYGAEYLYLYHDGTWTFAPAQWTGSGRAEVSPVDLTILTRAITNPEPEAVTA